MTVDTVTPSNTPAAPSLTNRYGAPKRKLSGKTKKLLIILACALASAWALWSVVGGTTGVSNKLVSYQVADATLTTVDLSVTKDPEATAQCAVQALNSSYAVVGSKVVTVGPVEDTGVDSRTTMVRGEIRTDSLSVTGVVEDCWIVDQP